MGHTQQDKSQAPFQLQQDKLSFDLNTLARGCIQIVYRCLAFLQ